MTKRTRTILFLIFLFFFLSAAPLAIFYSQGYRFDLNPPAGGIKLTQTGGLFLKVEPKQAEIYIDDKLAKETDFFFGSALIDNLLPKKYKVRVEKAGYQPWEKSLEIKEKEVVEVKNIVLFPDNLNFKELAKGIEKFWLSPNDKKIIIYEKTETSWALKLYDLGKNIKSHLISETDIYSKGANLMNLEFSQDSKEIYLDVEMKEQEKYFTLELDKSPPQLVERKVAPASGNIVASQKLNNDSYYLDNSGNFFKNELKLNEKPFPVKTETEYDLEIFQNFVFLHEKQTLYLFNSDSKSFEIFFQNIRNSRISPDNKKLVYFSDSEIWILFLKDKLDRPTKKAGEKLFINRLSEKIGDVFWLNPDYLIFSSGNNLKITEIDERDKIQSWNAGNFSNPEIDFNSLDKKLYLLSEGKLFQSVRLLP